MPDMEARADPPAAPRTDAAGRRPAGARDTARRVRDFALAFVQAMPAGTQIGAALLVVLTSLTEGIGLALLVPLVALIGETATSQGQIAGFAARALAAFGLPLSLQVLIAV